MNINDLSDEILLKVFNFCDCYDLQYAAEVCQKWNKIIGSSPSTISRFVLYISSHSLDNLEDILKRNWTYQNLNLCLTDKENANDKIFAALERMNLSQVRDLTLVGECSELQELIPRLLRQMPLLETLGYQLRQSPNLEKVIKIDKIVLPHLKDLIIASEDFRVLDCLEAVNLHSLTVMNWHEGEISSKEKEILFYLLEVNDKLNELLLNSKSVNDIFDSETPTNFNFKLTVLENSHGSDKHSPKCQENFSNFLKTQTALKEFTFLSVYPDLYLHLFNELENLESLHTDVEKFSSLEAFLSQLKPSQSIKKVEIYDEFQDTVAFAGFFRNCPALQNLRSNLRFKAQHFEILSSDNQNLEVLSFEFFDDLVPQEKTFKKLQRLHFGSCVNAEQLKSLILSCPNIAELSIGHLEYGSSKSLQFISFPFPSDFVTQKTNIKKLELYGRFEQIKPIFDAIKLSYGSLKELRLTIDDSDGTTVKVSKVNFLFPDDVTKWSVEEADKKYEQALLDACDCY